MNTTPLPVAIIGAGPCGLAAAVELGRIGRAAVVLEQGCVVSSIAAYPTYINFFSTAEKISIGGIPFALASEKPSRRDALAYYRMVVKHANLTVRQYEAVTQVERHGESFVVHTRRQDGVAHTLAASAVVVATGYFGTPNRLGVPGEDLPHASHWYRDGHEAFDREALVIGGGNSAVEAALDLMRCGARVTLAHVGPTWDRNIKPWIKPDIENRIADGTITAHWNTKVTAIRPGSVSVMQPEGPAELTADHVYLMTGYTPSPGLLNGLGIVVDSTTGIPEHNPETMETQVAGVFIAGVLASGFDANKIFIENGREHGVQIARTLATR